MEYLRRLKNPGTVITIASAIVLILENVGIHIDSEAVMNIVKAACVIGIALGVMNNPDTPGLDLPFLKENK